MLAASMDELARAALKSNSPCAGRILFSLDSASVTLSNLFTRMLSTVDSFQKPAIKGFRQRLRISEWVLPPGARVCIFAVVCLYPSYPIDRTGKMVRTSFYTYEARDHECKNIFQKKRVKIVFSTSNRVHREIYIGSLYAPLHPC